MQSTGQTDTHEMSSTSMHGSAITYVMQDPPRGVSIRLGSAPRPCGSRAYHRARSRGADPAHGDLHATLPVAGDVTADDERRRAAAGIARRNRPGDVHPLARTDDDAQPRNVGRHADDGRRPGRRPRDGRLGTFPGILDGRVADDRLMDLETAVDDVQEHG